MAFICFYFKISLKARIPNAVRVFLARVLEEGKRASDASISSG